MHLGTGRGYNVMEMVRAFERASGRAVPLQVMVMVRRPGDIALLCRFVTCRRVGWLARTARCGCHVPRCLALRAVGGGQSAGAVMAR